MNNIGDKLLPIGSVIILKNFNKKLMIIGYKSSIIGKPEMVFDYSACFYPDGFVSAEQSILFDHKQIEQVLFVGMTDENVKIETSAAVPAPVPVAETVVETPVEVPAAEPVVETPVEVPTVEPVVAPIDDVPVLDDAFESDGPSFDVTPISTNVVNVVETPVVTPATVPVVETPISMPVVEPVVETPVEVPSIMSPTVAENKVDANLEVVFPNFDLVAPTAESSVAPAEPVAVKSNDASSIFMSTPNNVQTPSELPVSLNPSIDVGLSVVADNKKEEATIQPKITGISDLMAGASDFAVSNNSSSDPANVNDIFPKSKFLGGFDSQSDNASSTSRSFL